MEKRLHDRLNKLEAIALNVLNTPKDEFINPESVSEDLIIYKYYNDSLCFWANTLPIANDKIFATLPDLVMHNLYRMESISQYPLLYVNESERYMNFGNAWYVVRAYYKSPYIVIAALLVQTESPFSNAFVENAVNPRLRLGNHFSIIQVNVDEGYPVFSRNGRTVLFNLLVDVQTYNQQSSMIFRWLSVLCAVLALFCFMGKRGGRQTLWIVLSLFGLLRLLCLFWERQLVGLPIASPVLYADPRFSESLANLLLNNLFIFFLISTVFVLRTSFSHFFYQLREMPFRGSKRILWSLFFALFPVLLFIYIHASFQSIIINSNIAMQIIKLNEVSVYSILVYASFGLLFAALYFLICLGWPVWVKKGSRSTLFSQRMLTVYIVMVSLYSLVIVSIYGARKELERNKVWTQKMAIERDPDTELKLSEIESYIASDIMLKFFLENNLPNDMIIERLGERFPQSLKNKYEIQVTTCIPGMNLLVDGTYPVVNCYNFFHQMISSYGTQLFEDAHFYHLNNPNGRISYIGVFPFQFFGGYCDLYIELNSRTVKEVIGYPELLRDQSPRELSRVPHNYSFAKYVLGEIHASSGNYIYPTQSTTTYSQGSFEVVKQGGYIHYINTFDIYTVITLSRPIYTPFLYLVSFSYLTLFYGLIVLSIIRFPTAKFWRIIPNRSFRRKITLLVAISLIGALIFMGYGSIWFGVKLFNDNNRRAMEEKIQTAQSMLELYFTGRDRLEDVDAELLFQSLVQLSTNVHIDINIYDSKGWLVQTSQPEILEKYLMGRRMNSKAFQMMARAHNLKFFHREHIGNLNYHSAYAPLFNNKGKLIAYLNLPYFSRESDVANDLASIVATIVNIYILLLLAAILTGTAISNQLGRPLIEVAKKMQRLDLTKQREHINYKGKDELGELIRTYNKMVDDVAEASRRMADTEREQAWREMARQIAHEIKNPLTPMRLSLQHLMRLKRENVPDWPERFDGLAHTLIEQIDILSDAASELSSFSRFYSEESTPVELNHLIREQCTLFSTGEAVHLYFLSEVDPATVLGRKQQLSRVLVNLISNSRQALEGIQNGQIRLRLTQQGDWFALHIEDNGPGVPEKLRNRLFTPNFTTKSGGTGLGLAICRSIIEQSQGTISYTTSEWGGASFTIKLPVLSV
ncbi:MAG: HAMP domain-containing histidine kinase [Bacteroidales bacterium]|nr:HAMP domain-containing histidine kinase [Bacteroidales bacterium]